MYNDKSLIYTHQPAFLGVNDLLYCPVKDLATALGAGISLKERQVVLSLKNKQTTVDLDSKDVLIQDGVVYVPVKAIVLKLGF
ncbi:stalk domain-containing protein [Paenibacillus tengchongensis]|uniref:stalk domain-containing protein n=1 Tax=Paenibacillus tengchongensis TaxID=2608684 RepID=UPI001651C2E5|nr:stalk domain-containing protein [Paenibacillus tengchongensis]